MKGQFTQSEAGNLTVLALGSSLFIWVDGVGYMTTNPNSPGVFDSKVHELEFSDGTIDDLKKSIDNHIQRKNDIKKYPFLEVLWFPDGVTFSIERLQRIVESGEFEDYAIFQSKWLDVSGSTSIGIEINITDGEECNAIAARKLSEWYRKRFLLNK